MSPVCNILVVANRTALAGLDDALHRRLEDGPAKFTLVVPIGRGPEALGKVAEIEATLRAVGLDIAVQAGVPDPLEAVLALYSPGEFDEIIVSTLPAWKSRWMKSGLPARIERHTGALVRHVEARDPAGLHHAPA